MRTPKQAQSVDRPIVMQATATGQVAPSGFLDTLGSIAKVALPIATSLLA